MSEVIAENTVVSFHYVLKDNDGVQIDASPDGKPLAYLHGAHNIVPGLEKELAGKTVGDKLEVKVSPEEGYGLRMHEPFEVPRANFPADQPIQPGMSFMAQAQDGQHFPLWVTKVTDTTVEVDPNHPLAGVELNFSVEIAAIRGATEEELAHGHPHGPGGHHH